VPNETLFGPGDGQGVVAGVKLNGVGAVKFGQGNPPSSQLRHGSYTLNNEIS
jgi:hypothetical protein